MSAAQGVLATLGLGQHDDSIEGLHLTKANQAHLVKVPLGRSSEISTGAAGSATVSVSPNLGAPNADGTGRAATITVPALTASVGSTAGQSGAFLEQTIYGPRVGVRFRRDNGASNYPFTISVDGVPYEVRNVNSRRHSQQQSYNDYEAMFVVADDLGPGAHTVRVSLAADQLGGVSRVIVIYGFVADRVAGYEDKRRLGIMPASLMQAMPTSATAMPVSTPGGLRKLHWYNTDVSPHTVTLTDTSANVFKVIVIAATTHAEYDFGEPIASGGSTSFLKWSCDSALVKYMIQEGA